MTKRTVSTDALETLGTLIDDTQKRDAIHLAVAKFRDHLEAEGAPVPAHGEASLDRAAALQGGKWGQPPRPEAPPVQSAPPGFRVVGRSGPGVEYKPGQWARYARTRDGTTSTGHLGRRISEKWVNSNIGTWDAGCWDILEPVDQPAAPPTSGAGEATAKCVCLHARMDHGSGAHTCDRCECEEFEPFTAHPAPQPSGNPGELPAKRDVVNRNNGMTNREVAGCILDLHSQEEWESVIAEELDYANQDGRDAAKKYAATWKALAKRYRNYLGSWKDRVVGLERTEKRLKAELADLKRAAQVQDVPCQCDPAPHWHNRHGELVLHVQPAPVDVIRGGDGERRLAKGWHRGALGTCLARTGRLLCSARAIYWRDDAGDVPDGTSCEAHAVEMGVFATEAPPQVGAGNEGEKP